MRDYLPLLVIVEFFPLFHHGVLAVRKRAAARRGASDAIKTRQRDLVFLQVICLALVGLGLALRVALGRSLGDVGVLAWLLFLMSFAAGIYCRYPEAAPIVVYGVDATDQLPGGQTLLRGMRYFYAALAGVMTPLLFVWILIG